ncbi:DNA polymerase III subunit beta [Xylocopilactobacillus apicola]|uniref:Beta sliding clamp n=1 Tax=Xylocopilactobacillus apicola TaxID=2932184 RepID=A0AAU9CYR3_9LACO|nr:DNA polymerase III subunit beta [Xylocopilactobacillus apicola]BDR57561.1 DNA polymerase III subunit beta [Xylocopilactobacillus apicola]
MKFKIKRNLLLKHITRANKGIASKTPQEVLHNLFLEVLNDQIRITGSNSSLRIESEIPVDNNEDLQISEIGSIIVDAKLLTDIIRRMSNEYINLELVGQRTLHIFDVDTEFKVQISKQDEYPTVEKADFQNSYTMSSEIFSNVIKDVIFAISKLEIQVVMTGVNLRFEPGKIYFIATDSHRLSQRVIEAPEVTSNFSVIIPGSNLNVLLGLLEEEKEVRMSVSDDLVVFRFSDYSFYSRLIKETYPDTDAVFPHEFNMVVKADTHEWFQAVERAAIISSGNSSNMITFNLDGDRKKIILSGVSDKEDSYKEELPFSEITGDNLVIHFNANFMLDALRAYSEGETQMNFTTSRGALTLENENYGESFLQLVTPIITYD